MQDQFLWVEKYRPKKIEECILPKQLKETFQQIVDSGELPNLMFTGTAGLGKTTVARALCEQLGIDYIIINGSEEVTSILFVQRFVSLLLLYPYKVDINASSLMRRII